MQLLCSLVIAICSGLTASTLWPFHSHSEFVLTQLLFTTFASLHWGTGKFWVPDMQYTGYENPAGQLLAPPPQPLCHCSCSRLEMADCSARSPEACHSARCFWTPVPNAGKAIPALRDVRVVSKPLTPNFCFSFIFLLSNRPKVPDLPSWAPSQVKLPELVWNVKG